MTTENKGGASAAPRVLSASARERPKRVSAAHCAKHAKMAPIAIVAALRETSVLFAAVISVVILKEQLRPARVIAALMIVFGLALIRLH
jgi:drug/metabolite transporter (DMT)-like permease